MKTIAATTEVLVLRVDFSDDSSWNELCSEIKTPNYDFDLIANVEFCNNKEFESLTIEQVVSTLSKNYEHSIIFIADTTTFSNKEHPVLCVELREQRGESFRVIPAEMCLLEINISLSNMDFFEFAENTEPDGIFRGFKKK